MRRFISILLLTGMLTTTACSPLYQLCDLFGCVPTDHGENHKRRNVILLHKDGGVYFGEIYAIRDSSLMFCTKENVMNGITTSYGYMQIVDFKDIDGVMRGKESRVFLGAIAGFLVGMGYMWYEDYKESKQRDEGLHPCGGVVGPYDYLFGFIFSLGTATIGGVIGLIYPDPEKKIVPDSKKEIKELRSLARFPYQEPSWLQELIPQGGITG